VPKVRFAGTIRPSGHRPGRAITGHSNPTGFPTFAPAPEPG